MSVIVKFEGFALRLMVELLSLTVTIKKIKSFDQNVLYLAAYAFHSLQSDQIHISVVNNNAVRAHVYEQTGGRLYTFDITDNLFLVKENNPMWNGGFLLSISSCLDKIVKTGTTFGGNAVTLTDRRGEDFWSRSKSTNGQNLFELPQFSACFLENNKPVIVITDSIKNTITKLGGETGEILNIISDDAPRFDVAVDADRGILYVCKRNMRRVYIPQTLTIKEYYSHTLMDYVICLGIQRSIPSTEHC